MFPARQRGDPSPWPARMRMDGVLDERPALLPRSALGTPRTGSGRRSASKPRSRNVAPGPPPVSPLRRVAAPAAGRRRAVLCLKIRTGLQAGLPSRPALPARRGPATRIRSEKGQMPLPMTGTTRRRRPSRRVSPHPGTGNARFPPRRGEARPARRRPCVRSGRAALASGHVPAGGAGGPGVLPCGIPAKAAKVRSPAGSGPGCAGPG